MTDERDEASVTHAIQRASIERALVDETAAPAHLALAGALEAARTGADDPPLPGLVPLAIVGALGADDRSDDASRPAVPRTIGSPEPHPGARSSDWLADAHDVGRRVRVDGAAVAVRRFDLSVDRAAALAAVPTAELRTALGDGERDPAPEREGGNG